MHRRVNIEQVVVRKFFSVKLIKNVVKIAVIAGSLMRVFAVAQIFKFGGTYFERRRVKILAEITINRRIVMRTDVESSSGHFFAVGETRFTILFFKDVKQVRIVFHSGNDHHILKVFGGSPNKGYATDVYFFDDVFIRSTRHKRFLKGV